MAKSSILYMLIKAILHGNMVHFLAQNNRNCRVKHTRFDLHPIFVTIYMAGRREEYAWGDRRIKHLILIKICGKNIIFAWKSARVS